MATFYLINSIQLAANKYLAGVLLNDAVDPTTAIAAQGGVLVASSDGTVAAAAAVAQAARKVGVSSETLDSIMMAGYEKSIAATLVTTNSTLTTATGNISTIQTELTAVKSIGAALTDADATIQVTAGRHRTLPASTLGANRQLTLGTTGAVAGDMITITRLDAGAYTYAIINGGAGAGTLYTLPVSKTGFVQAIFNGTNWIPRAFAVSP